MIHRVSIKYSTVVASRTINHRQNMWFEAIGDPAPETPVADIDVALKGGGDSALSALMTSYVTTIRPLFHTTSSLVGYEVWKHEDESSDDAEWISAETIALAGTGTNPTVTAGQAQIVFRAGSQTQARFSYMESVIASSIYDPAPIANAQMATIASNAVAPTGWQKSRKGFFLQYAVAGSYGENEALARKRYRD